MPNVMEPWTIYDSIVICRQFYGNELTVPGWFNSFQNFGNQQLHRFFKSRNEAGCSLAYNNMQSQDRADFAFHVISMGVYFAGPVTPLENIGATEDVPLHFNPAMSSYFMFDLPNQAAFSFKMGQDVRLDASGYHVPPGYGPRMSGFTQGRDVLTGELLAVGTPPVSTYTEAEANPTLSQATMIGTQGEPTNSNRFYFNNHIEIPRGETFEVTMSLTEHTRRILANTSGPLDYAWLTATGGEVPRSQVVRFPTRYVITCALHGLREVQQRGQLHA
jgi:hypothetical protein